MLLAFLSMDRRKNGDDGSTAIDRIAGVLAPYLGQHMTNVSIEMYQKKLGISGVSTPAQREELIAHLERGLKIFVGEERTASLAAEMRNVAKGD